MASRASLSSTRSPSCPPLTHWALPLRATQWLRWLPGGGTPSIASRTCPCLASMEWRWATTGNSTYIHMVTWVGCFDLCQCVLTWNMFIMYAKFDCVWHCQSILKTLLHCHLPSFWAGCTCTCDCSIYVCTVGLAFPTVLYHIQHLHSSNHILYAGYGWGPDWEWGGVWWAGPSGIVSTWGLVDELCEAAEVSGENWKEGGITIEVFVSNRVLLLEDVMQQSTVQCSKGCIVSLEFG